MATQRVVLTYEDYVQLPNDGRRYEIHDGELSVTPSPGTPHQRTIEVYALAKSRYRLVTIAGGAGLVSLPPFPDLAFAPGSLWP